MPDTKQTVLEQAVADQWKVLPSGLTVLVRPMPGYSGTHVIYATRFGSIDRDFRLDDKEVHLPAGVAHFLEHKMFEDQDGDAFAKFAKTGANANAFTAFDRTCYLFTATEQLDESLLDRQLGRHVDTVESLRASIAQLKEEAATPRAAGETDWNDGMLRI